MSNFNFNRVILGGRLTSDPEVKTTQSGTPVCSFIIAVNRPKPKEGEEQQSDFISCVAWRERAELIGKYFRKGSSICIVGEIQTRKWQDNNGNKRYATEVIVSEVNFVDSKLDATASSPTTYVPDVYKAPTFEASDADDGDLPF